VTPHDRRPPEPREYVRTFKLAKCDLKESVCVGWCHTERPLVAPSAACHPERLSSRAPPVIPSLSRDLGP